MGTTQGNPSPPFRSEEARVKREGMDQGVSALSYLITGVLLWGGAGFAGDHFWHLHFLTPIGVVIGAGLGCYMIIVRFGGLRPRARQTSEGGDKRPAETSPSGESG